MAMASSSSNQETHLYISLLSTASVASHSTPSPSLRISVKAPLLALSLLLFVACIAFTKPAFLRLSESPSKSSPVPSHGTAKPTSVGSHLNSAIKTNSTHGSSPSMQRKSGSYAELVHKHKTLSGSEIYLKQAGEDASFYQPKSTAPTIFSEDGRLYSPWNSTAYESLRTAFHFQPESNWMNDPNAPLYYNGWYHLFYQYNPYYAYWGLISWGHAVSVDLIHWLYLDLAMEPDQWYDINGVWTGSATFLEDGTPLVLYTGSTNESAQVQNLAFPSDPTDFLLRNWTKYAGNPVLVPPTGILSTDFRDPTTAWIGTDGLWRLGIGSKLEQKGIAMVYSSSDFINWTMHENYLHEVEGTGMWECLDFFPVNMSGSAMGVDTSIYGEDVKHVLKSSMDNSKLDFYVIGTYDYENYTFIPDDPSADLGLGLRYDYGKFYASKTFYDANEGRRILWGWINESDSLQDDIEKGWASVQALPRQVWFDNVTQANLLQWPVDEVLDLRRTKVTLESTVLESGSVVEVSGGSGAQLDIELTFNNPTTSIEGHRDIVMADESYSCSEGTAARQGYYGPFGLLVLASEDLQEQTSVYFYFATINGKWTAFICNDQSRSTLASEVDIATYGSVVPVLETETSLSVRVIVDHSIVETYAQGGRTCVTSRVYPTLALEDAAQLFVFNNGTMPVTLQSLTAWQVSKVYMHAYSTVQ
ncbi:hypothetical protein GOP47_0027294 [Adiantum capillus-veneris]|nr:hypothetical protein GOP47_0027294 [Adiantum capillus-veneris]